jgi:hypothetical protein
MAIQLETSTRNSMLDAITTKVGASCKIRIYSGTIPANCAAAITGTLLAELTGNATFAPGASGGVLTLNAITQDSVADNSGTASHFRIWDSGAATCYLQGTVTATGGGGDLTLNTVSVVANAIVSITSFTLTAPGA